MVRQWCGVSNGVEGARIRGCLQAYPEANARAVVDHENTSAVRSVLSRSGEMAV